ncbi:MAG: PEP-CTERM sorting domain-containing protein [Pseudomonadota bacterium]|nr:PEP-CTERM sorting domain-containing protein [Pseudomonadota bacterium]
MNGLFRRGLLLGTLGMVLPWTGAVAVPFTTDLTITGSVDFDNANAVADGNVTQTGSFFTTEGGVTTSSTFSGTTVTGDDPLPGTLTDLDDGFGISADVDAAFDSEFFAGIDIVIDVANTSATDTYKVTFKIDFSNLVDADGADAFAESEFIVDSPPGTEVFFSDLLSDTVNGDEAGGMSTGTAGEVQSESGMVFFDVIVAPLTTAQITADWTLDGGVFADPGAAIADFFGFISVDNVMNQTAPPGVPAPATLVLLGLGLGGVGALRRRAV